MKQALNKSGGKLSKVHHFEFRSSLWRSMGADVKGVPELPSRTEEESLPAAGASTVCRHDQLAPVTRRYQPQPAALEELVDVLYRLLVDVPADVPAVAPAPSGPTCFSIAPE
jgi:hypothetical protein